MDGKARGTLTRVATTTNLKKIGYAFQSGSFRDTSGLTLSLLTVNFPKYKLGKIEKQYHSEVLLNSFPVNGHTAGFCP